MSNVASDLTPSAFDLPSSNPATLVNITGTNFPVQALSYAGAGAGNLAYVKLSALFYAGGTLSLRLNFYSAAGSTAGNVTWAAAIAPTVAGATTSVEALAFNTAASVTTAINANAKGDTLTTITISDVTGLVNGGIFWLRITRTDSSMTGAAILTKADITWSDGVGGATGGDVVGPSSATNNAVALYDLTTGKLLKNSVVTVDGSGNVAGLGTLNTRTIANWVDGPASVTDGRVAVFDTATGKLIKQGTQLAADLVSGPASSAGGNVPTFNGATGKIIQDSGVALASLAGIQGTPTPGRMAGWATATQLGAASIDTTQVVANTSGTGVVVGELAQFVISTAGTRINGGGAGSKLLADVVTNPSGSATIGRIAIMNSTSGTEIGQGSILASNIVTGPATSTNGNIATYNGATGKVVQDSGIAIAQIAPDAYTATVADSAALTTTVTVVISLPIPSTGTWQFTISGRYVLSTTTANNVTFRTSYSGSIGTNGFQTRFQGNTTAANFASGYTISSGTDVTIAPTLTSDMPFVIVGHVVATTTGNLTLAMARASSGTVILRAGSNILATKVA